RFDTDARVFTVRNGEGRVTVEIAKGNQRAASFDDASADRAIGAKQSPECERGASRFGRDVALARYRFPDGRNILSRGFTTRVPVRRCRQGGNRRNGGVYYRSDESDE